MVKKTNENLNKNTNIMNNSEKIISTSITKCQGSNRNTEHPVVYLHVDSKGIAICPYCSQKFIKPQSTDINS